MSISELASCSGVSVKVIQGQIDAGKLTAKSIGGKVFVRVSDFWNSLNSVEVVTESAT
ncbi:MAG: DNA-binding protein [Hyphomicrobiaceae bacterium]|nr:MAG: DNA-binding protein [Hyphomicrobiaceae bacterium]